MSGKVTYQKAVKQEMPIQGSEPCVSVLMTTFNGAGLIRTSIDSVLAQTFTDFELIVVDDASTDDTLVVLGEIHDPRLRVLRSERNLGVTGARNLGFAACRGRYVAAHDHDDVSLPTRLAEQVAHLDQHPATVLVATEVLLSRNGRLSATDHAKDGSPLAMRWMVLVDNPLTWSSVMFRADTVRSLGVFMREEFDLADDFEFYHRLLKVGDIVRLESPLTVYRWHAANTTYAGAQAQRARAVRVLQEAYAGLLGDESADAAELVVDHLSARQPIGDAATLDRLGVYLERLLRAFAIAQRLEPGDLARVATHAGRAWWLAVRAATRRGRPWLLRCFYRRRGLARAFHPMATDVLVSIAVGSVRAARP